MALLWWAMTISPSVASDHIDGHEVRSDRHADLADLYAWTPAPGRVAVALTWGPLTRRRARPQEDLAVRLRVRRVDGEGVDEEELSLRCQGERGARRADELVCTLGKQTFHVPWGGSAADGTTRIFAGVRRDPFFIALGKVARDVPAEGERRSVRGVDFLHNRVIRGRVEALVVEFDARDVPGERPWLGVVAESWRGPEQRDRLGRPEIGNFVLAKRFGETLDGPDVRAAWNHEDAFAPSPGHLGAYEVAMAEGLARLDARDERGDWATPHPLAARLLSDWLIVDPTRTCDVDDPTFLEIEAAWLAGVPHMTCGGRPPNDDAVDRLLTWTINGPERVPPGPPLHGPPAGPAPRRGDGVDRPGAPATSKFPYLREP
ncbi:MAG: hypothetical protein EP330_17960 [Deltaproteobacteria bacterium]|nr:MAG: hypothetical protein EP330_17960 [Deltaproteobacteria bacterium]